MARRRSKAQGMARTSVATCHVLHDTHWSLDILIVGPLGNLLRLVGQNHLHMLGLRCPNSQKIWDPFTSLRLPNHRFTVSQRNHISDQDWRESHKGLWIMLLSGGSVYCNVHILSLKIFLQLTPLRPVIQFPNCPLYEGVHSWEQHWHLFVKLGDGKLCRVPKYKINMSVDMYETTL